MSTEQILAALTRIGDRIDAAFAEDADKYAADKHLCLEQVGDDLTALIDRIRREG